MAESEGDDASLTGLQNTDPVDENIPVNDTCEVSERPDDNNCNVSLETHGDTNNEQGEGGKTNHDTEVPKNYHDVTKTEHDIDTKHPLPVYNNDTEDPQHDEDSEGPQHCGDTDSTRNEDNIDLRTDEDPEYSNSTNDPIIDDDRENTNVNDDTEDYQYSDEREDSLCYVGLNDDQRQNDAELLKLVDPKYKNSFDVEPESKKGSEPSAIIDNINTKAFSDIAHTDDYHTELTFDSLESGEVKTQVPDEESVGSDDFFGKLDGTPGDDTNIDDIESVTYMLNSEEYYDEHDKSPSLTTANVSGFSEVKHKNSLDYLFVIEVMWSDGKSLCIKRTYKNFLSFRKTLVEFFQRKPSDDDLERDPVFIPNLTGLKLFRRYDRELAEEREMELQDFLKNLLNGNPMVSTAAPVLEFFEPKATDPIPYRGCPDGDESAEEDDPFAEEVFSLRWIRGEK